VQRECHLESTFDSRDCRLPAWAGPRQSRPGVAGMPRADRTEYAPLFLFGCIALRQLAFALGPGTASEIAAEGLLIIGWVAMWRPLEIFLYDWRPLHRRYRLLAKLCEIPVVVSPST
jgi:hypothetical protein